MNSFNQTNHEYTPSTLAAKSIENLNQCMGVFAKLDYLSKKEKIITSKNTEVDHMKWAYILSFMVRKLSSIYLGQTDEDYAIKDLSFSFIYRKDFENEHQKTRV